MKTKNCFFTALFVLVSCLYINAQTLEEAKKNREIDELEGKRNIQNEDSILNNLNKKYLYQKGFSEEDNEEFNY